MSTRIAAEESYRELAFLKENITLSRFKDSLQKNNYIIPYDGIVTFGIRNNDMTAGIFNDFLGMYYTTGRIEYLVIHTGTVDPGSYYLNNPMNANGTAVMKYGHYKASYSLGLHNGKYEALIQVKPISFYRITKNEFEEDNKGIPQGQWKIDVTGKKLYTDKIGANQHRASANSTTELIGMYSAGCQVRNNPDEYKVFIDTCKKSKQKYFDYILFSQKDLLT